MLLTRNPKSVASTGMTLPRARGKRIDIYLDDEVYMKAVRRFANLDAKIEQLLREEIEREEQANAAHGFGSNAETAAEPGFEDLESGGDAFFELNPGMQQIHAESARRGKRERLPVLKPKRRRR